MGRALFRFFLLLAIFSAGCGGRTPPMDGDPALNSARCIDELDGTVFIPADGGVALCPASTEKVGDVDDRAGAVCCKER